MSPKLPRHVITLIALIAPLLARPLPSVAAGEVNLYSAREPGLINPLLERFTT